MRTQSTFAKWYIAATLALLIGITPFLPAFAAVPVSTAPTQSIVTPQVSDEEAAGLIFMVEEEKLARDLYLALNQEWSLRIFSNIAKAEQQHMDAVRGLLDLYGLADPTLGQPAGVFQDPSLQALYDELLATGSVSLTAALQAGVAVEETDIADLDQRLDQTSNLAIVQVYTRLRTGSTHHLQAFTRTLQRMTGNN